MYKLSKIWAVGFLFVFCTYSMSSLFLNINYQIFSELITENFCVNKDDASCSGKCHLTMQIKKTEQKKSESKATYSENIILYFTFNTIKIIHSALEREASQYFCLLGKTSTFVTFLLKPPSQK